MIELNAHNALAYLKESGRLPDSLNAKVAQLDGGVSNVVLRVMPDVGADFVLKQSRAQLRTREQWFSRLDRIFREIDVLRLLMPLVPVGVVPQVLFEDRENYAFAMEAVEADHVVWKQALLKGDVDYSIAGRLGACLATIHRETSFDSGLYSALRDREVFVQLRIDPFYVRLAAEHPAIAPQVAALIAETERNALCVVHADFSPKNILIAGPRIALVDFETGHYGDPAFDLGFFLSHLLLKGVLHSRRFSEYAGLTTAFWKTYLDGLEQFNRDDGPLSAVALTKRAIPHLAACMWARIDATSKIDYISDETRRQLIRDFCRGLLDDAPQTWDQLLDRLQSALQRLDAMGSTAGVREAQVSETSQFSRSP